MSLNFIHSDKYADAIKVASKFTGGNSASSNSYRPILFFVNHKKDGSITATDSHRFITVKNIHGFETDYLVHPKTLEFATGSYPDVEKYHEIIESPTIIELNKDQIAIWLQLHRSINQLSKHYDPRNRMVTLSANNSIELSIGTKDHVEMNLPYLSVVDKETLNYNAEYMRDCLEVHHVLGTEKLEIIINGKMRPIVLSGDEGNVISGLVPVRTY